MLAWFCDPDFLPEVEDDLYEICRRWVQQYGLRKAQWLYFFNTLTYFSPAFFKRKTVNPHS